ncbi:MAG: AraC family transcriptional regulator, partial [Cyanobacteriota bacterium]
ATDELTEAHSVEINPHLKLRDLLIREIGLALWHELTADGVGSRLYVESLFAALSAHLIRHHCTSKPKISTASGGLSQAKLRQVIEYINDNLEQDLSLRAIAQTVQMSPYHFARRFKLSTGLTPHQYVLHCRLERAKRLLADTELAITDIAYRAGFSSPSHLTRVFRQHIATTPKAYREAL